MCLVILELVAIIAAGWWDWLMPVPMVGWGAWGGHFFFEKTPA